MEYIVTRTGAGMIYNRSKSVCNESIIKRRR